MKELVITNAGSGYNTPPEVTIAGMESINLKATLSFTRNLPKNGGISMVEHVDSAKIRGQAVDVTWGEIVTLSIARAAHP